MWMGDSMRRVRCLRGCQHKEGMQQRGDTIVEVLIATAIIALLLTTASAIVSRNTNASLDVQEHMVAQKILEQQAESLRIIGALDTTTSPCFSGVSPASAATDCVVNSDGETFDETSDSGAKYTILITKASPNSKEYSLKISWVTPNGNNAYEQVYYRPPQ